jgi:hypothetical protein
MNQEDQPLGKHRSEGHPDRQREILHGAALIAASSPNGDPSPPRAQMHPLIRPGAARC